MLFLVVFTMFCSLYVFLPSCSCSSYTFCMSKLMWQATCGTWPDVAAVSRCRDSRKFARHECPTQAVSNTCRCVVQLWLMPSCLTHVLQMLSARPPIHIFCRMNRQWGQTMCQIRPPWLLAKLNPALFVLEHTQNCNAVKVQVTPLQLHIQILISATNIFPSNALDSPGDIHMAYSESVFFLRLSSAPTSCLHTWPHSSVESAQSRR